MKTKNVKIKNVLAIVAIITIMLLTFVACDSPQTTEPNFQQFEIKFYLNESDETPYATLKVAKRILILSHIYQLNHQNLVRRQDDMNFWVGFIVMEVFLILTKSLKMKTLTYMPNLVL